MKTDKQCTWDEIKVGEVFTWEGCWKIFYKDSKDGPPIFLAEDDDEELVPFGKKWSLDIRIFSDSSCYGLYKLPKSVQALWKEE